MVDSQTEAERQLRGRLVNEGRLVRLASAFVNLPVDQLDDGRRHRARGDGWAGRRRPGRGRPVRPRVERHDQHPRVGGHGRGGACGSGSAASPPRTSRWSGPCAATRRSTSRRSHALGSAWKAEKDWFEARGVQLGAGRPAVRPGPAHRVPRLRVGRSRVDVRGRAHQHPAQRGRHPRPGLRPVGGRGPAGLPGPPRPADRPAQPMGLPRGHGPGRPPARSRAASRVGASPCCSSTSIASR